MGDSWEHKKELAFTFTACGGGGTPEAVAEKYVKAIYALDSETVTNLASSKYKGEAAKMVDMTKKIFSAEELKVLQGGTIKASPAEISADENSATVKVEMTANGRTVPTSLSLVKEDGAWKVKSQY